MMQVSLRCIHCDQPPKKPFIQLKQGNVIDAICLAEIQKLIKENEGVDEVIVQVYQHILDLVVKCTHCKSTIDGFYKTCFNKGQNKEPYCHQCGLLGVKAQKNGKEGKGTCIQCQAELDCFQLLSSIDLGGIYLCENCHDSQNNHKFEEKIERKQVIIPKHIERQVRKPMLNHKSCMPNMHINPFKMQKINLKNEIQYEEADPMLLFNNRNKLSADRHNIKSPPPLKYKPFQKKEEVPQKQVKLEKVKCDQCENLLQPEYFNDIIQGFYICISCMNITGELQKKFKEKKDGKIKGEYQDLYLEQLFKETPTQQNKPEMVQKIQTSILKSPPRSNIYQLKQCKLCFNGESTMINIACRHLMMCQKCYKSYQKKNQRQELPCPVCNTQGRYQRYIVPIYI